MLSLTDCGEGGEANEVTPKLSFVLKEASTPGIIDEQERENLCFCQKIHGPQPCPRIES